MNKMIGLDNVTLRVNVNFVDFNRIALKEVYNFCSLLYNAP